MLKKILIIFTILAGFFLTAKLNPINAAASLYLTASTTKPYVGNTFRIYPKVNTGGASTNAYKVTISYSNSYISGTGASTGGSICNLYTEGPTISSTSGNLACGKTSGYSGSGGGLGYWTFKAKSAGTATISITSASQVLANDGYGTNILGSRSGITITVVTPPPPPPPPVTAPSVSANIAQNSWSKSNDVTFTWTKPAKVTGYSYTLTTDQGAVVASSNLGGGTSKSYKDLADGTYYFKIKATDGSKWSNVVSYTILIDTTAPEQIEIITDPLNDKPIKRLPMISFNAVDSGSGVSYYEVSLDGAAYIKTTSPYTVPAIGTGSHEIKVRVTDKAGNSGEAATSFEIAKIEAPNIDLPITKSLFHVSDRLLVKGTSGKNSFVYIYLNNKEIASVKADKQGRFVHEHDELLMPGKYTLTARMKNEGGILGIKAEEVDFEVDGYAIKFAGLVIPGTTSLLIVILIILLLLSRLVWIFFKRRREKDQNEKRLQSIEKEVERNLDQLEKDVRDDIGIVLNKTGGKKVSKKIEDALEQKLVEDVENTERRIDGVIDKDK